MSERPLSPRPLIIVGAGRSGTNALRDALCSLTSYHTWPCDEINYIWRYGNRTHPTDELTPAHATKGRAYIRNQFAKRNEKDPSAVLIEKTCANSLRVGFVNAVVPEARFVHIVREPRDAVASAIKRWTAELDIPYLARKARFVPRRDLLPYAFDYLGGRVRKSADPDGRLPTWGPRFEGMDSLANTGELHELAAGQWARCVALASAQLQEIPAETLHIRYEQLVSGPADVLHQILDFTDVVASQAAVDRAARTIHGGSVGKWADSLSDEQGEDILRIAQDAGVELP